MVRLRRPLGGTGCRGSPLCGRAPRHASSAVLPVFRMYGISPIWGMTHRKLCRHSFEQEIPQEPTSLSAWLPESNADLLGIAVAHSAVRIVSPWGRLVNGRATSDPSLLSYDAFLARRIPLKLSGVMQSPHVSRRLQRLMLEAPSEFSSLYWGTAQQFSAAGVELMAGSHAVSLTSCVQLYNAAQTTKRDLFAPRTCIAFVPQLVPEMKFDYSDCAYYRNVVSRGFVNCNDYWHTEDFVRSRDIRLKPGAQCIVGRYYEDDFLDSLNAINAKHQLRREKNSAIDGHPLLNLSVSYSL